MAERPVFVPAPKSPHLVKEVFLSIKWNPGLAVIQKEKNIRALHEAAAVAGYKRVLEVSTKADSKRGQHLSAFHLKVRNEAFGEMLLECAFQGSKVFEDGGPYTDLYLKDPRDAKKDSRLQKSGGLIGFEFEGFTWPLEPKTAFYDWLYAGCIYPHREWARKLYVHGGFSDIEFNPYRSVNCQARAIALFLSLMKRGQLDGAMRSPAHFLQILMNSQYRPQLRSNESDQEQFIYPA